MELSAITNQVERDVFRAIEKLALNHLKQNPVLAAGGTATNFQVSAFSYMLGGVVYNKGAQNNIAHPGASTAEGEFRKVLIAIDAAGAVTAHAGAIAASQEDAMLPEVPEGKLPIGFLELPGEFTAGTTSVTAGMCKLWQHSIDVVH